MDFGDVLHRLGLIGRNVSMAGNVWLSRRLRNTPKRLPILLLFVTDRCNLRCKMCGVWERLEPNGKTGELTTEEWKAVIRSASGLGTILLSITGGEPLLRRDIYEIITCARAHGMAVHLCSNGTIITQRIAERLDASGVDTVSISIESPTAPTHDYLRGEGSFVKAVAGVGVLRKHAPSVRVGINYLITAQNYRDMDEMVRFAETLGVDQIKFAPIHTNLLHKHKDLSAFEFLTFREHQLDELEAEVKKLMRAAKRSPLQTTSTMFLAGITSLYSGPRTFCCYAGYAACAVNPRGIVTPCCDMDGTLSVRDRPLDEIWRSEEFAALRDRVHTCGRSCWDTTNAELSLRLTVRSLFCELAQTWRDMGFYLKKDAR